MIGQGKTRFVMDFQNCTGMDSTFLGVLAGEALELRRKNPPGASWCAGRGIATSSCCASRSPPVAHRGTPRPRAGSGDAATPLRHADLAGQLENARLVLEAHENLITADPANRASFRMSWRFCATAWNRSRRGRDVPGRRREPGWRVLNLDPAAILPKESPVCCFFLMGAAAGVLAVFWFGAKARARADRLEAEKMLLAQEKQIVVDFMHHMVRALGEGVSRDELFQRIVHAAILCTGALSACIFESGGQQNAGRGGGGALSAARPLPPQLKTKLTTRARFIEQVLKSELFDINEGVVGQWRAPARAN